MKMELENAAAMTSATRKTYSSPPVVVTTEAMIK